MRKAILIVTIICCGCASQDDLSIITDEIREQILIDMNDPSSFSFVNSEIRDTVHYGDVTGPLLESIEEGIDRNEGNLARTREHIAEFGELGSINDLIGLYEGNLSDLHEEREIIEIFIGDNPDRLDEVAYYRVSFSYRETNPMGATILNKMVYDANITESGDVDIFWSADEEVISELEKADLSDESIWPLFEEVYSGSGRQRVMQEIGLN